MKPQALASKLDSHAWCLALYYVMALSISCPNMPRVYWWLYKCEQTKRSTLFCID